MRLISLALVLAAVPARAADCPVPEGFAPSLALVDGADRLRFLRYGMRHAAHESRVWAWSTVGVQLLAGNVQLLGATHSDDPGQRIDLWFGVGAVGFSLLQIAAVPPLVTIDQLVVEKRSAREGSTCAVLADAERRLERDAWSERRGTGPAMHVATILVNVAAALALGILFDRWTSAEINLFAGTAVGELQVLTEPTLSVDLFERYRAGDLTPRKGERTALRWRVAPMVRSDGGGLGFALGF